MKRILVVVIVMIVSSAVTASASPAETIPAAEDWWDRAINVSDVTVSKKAPLHYGVFPYAHEACGAFEKKRVDKVSNGKGLSALLGCLAGASQAEEEPEYLWEPSDVEMLLIGFDHDKKLVKKIRKAVKKLEIVSLEIRGKEDAAAVHVFFAIDKKGNVKGVFMYVDSAN